MSAVAETLIPLDVDFAVDPETGEVTCRTHEEFVIDDERKADWVLGQFLAIDAQIAAVDGSELVAQARAIVANAESKKKTLNGMRKALEWRFSGDLQQFALNNAPRGQKTWKGICGAVSVRTVAAKRVVTDEGAAIAWLKDHTPGALKVSVLVSRLPECDVPGVEVEPARESVTIRTMAGKGGDE